QRPAVQYRAGRAGIVRHGPCHGHHLAAVAPHHPLFRLSFGGAAISRLCTGQRRALVGGRVFAGLGSAAGVLGLCVPTDPGAPDGTAISMALPAQRLAGLGGAALSFTSAPHPCGGVIRETSMRRIFGTLAVATVALAAVPAFAQIKIGAAGPMTGPDAVFGEQMKRGAEMAVADINAAGGVNGQKLELVVGDDACDPKQATAVANKMVTDKVVFVAGHYCSSSSIPASDIYKEGKVLQITPASTNPKLTDDAFAKGNTTVFRTVGRDDIQGPTMAAYVLKNNKNAKIAIIHDKTAYGKGVADEFKKALNKG